MKKISVSLFFTVLWRGVCQALGWFFGLFGYKRDGKYATCIWRMFATSAAIITTIMAIVLVWAIGETVYEKHFKEAHCYNPDCFFAKYISENVYYHDLDDDKGYVFNSLTGDKTIRNIRWIARSEDNDSLICFSNGKKRGYFSKYTGKVVIEPKYDHAWVFSEGLASVEEGGYIKFIDGTGKVVIDKKLAYIPNMDGYMFHGGYCIVGNEDNKLYGMMDKTGKMVLPQEYCSITPTYDHKYWAVKKGSEMGVLDKNLKPVVPMTEASMYVGNGTIDMTMPDHTIRKYDMEGHLINDFYITSVRMLEYEKDEIKYRTDLVNKVDDEITEILEETYHPKATARLRAYVAGGEYEGLMTAEGHVMTMPLYTDIIALDHDLYLCTFTNNDKVIVNGKGEIVK